MPRLVRGAGPAVIESIGTTRASMPRRVSARTRTCGVCGASPYAACYRERHDRDGTTVYVPLKIIHQGR
jgi:hypothetical protein